LFYSEETEIRNCQGFFKRVVCANKMVEWNFRLQIAVYGLDLANNVLQ
jgi:hypothetical protein